jgi:hypothetical protein
MKTFGQYEVRYGSILDHDTYEYLQLRLYPKEDNPRLADIMLNGEIVGQVLTERNFYYPFRFDKKKEKFMSVLRGREKAKYRTIGQATASVLSDFIK